MTSKKDFEEMAKTISSLSPKDKKAVADRRDLIKANTEMIFSEKGLHLLSECKSSLVYDKLDGSTTKEDVQRGSNEVAWDIFQVVKNIQKALHEQKTGICVLSLSYALAACITEAEESTGAKLDL